MPAKLELASTWSVFIASWFHSYYLWRLETARAGQIGSILMGAELYFVSNAYRGDEPRPNQDLAMADRHEVRFDQAVDSSAAGAQPAAC